VLPNAQIIDTTKMITNWETGKKNLSWVCKIRAVCKHIVYPTSRPIITPIKQLANTSTRAS
jgi:hypothetical protein